MPHGMTERFNTTPLDAADWDRVDYLLTEKDGLDKKSFLPPGAATIEALKILGDSMSEGTLTTPAFPDTPSKVSAVLTYFGQFIDHDITKTVSVGGLDDNKIIGGTTDFTPFDRASVGLNFRNMRTSGFDLDSLYGLDDATAAAGGNIRVPFDGDLFHLGVITPFAGAIPGKTADNDLPRLPPELKKLARIGDERNDENVIIAQLHLAFLKFHNAVVQQGNAFDKARTLVVRHYQWLVLHEFLPAVCDPSIVKRTIESGNRIYKPRDGEKFMPLEFSTAAYRFGHSMIRSAYDFNRNFKRASPAQALGTLDLMFEFTAKSGNFGGQPTLPSNWIIEWDMMLKDKALQIDPSLTPFLAKLPGVPAPINVMQHLARRNLLKGYLFHVPTGQAMAQLLLAKSDHMTPAELQAACVTPRQKSVLKSAKFDKATPLWFYILAEAKVKGAGERLGPLGSLVVAETIIGLMRANPESILNKPFQPTLGQVPGRFDLQDLLMLAGVHKSRVSV